MGIPPYMTPAELHGIDQRIKHYQDWLEANGYKCVYETNPTNGYFERKKPFVAPNGNSYNTAEDFYKGYGWYPHLEKDGICYGYYEPRGEYVDPWDSEVAFLQARGYTRVVKKMSEDYLENNRLFREFYEQHGFVPRWEKDGKQYGHEQLLEAENYK